MERLVTIADLQKYPHLIRQGVSVNQYYNFSELESSQVETEQELLDVDTDKKTPPNKPKKK